MYSVILHLYRIHIIRIQSNLTPTHLPDYRQRLRQDILIQLEVFWILPSLSMYFMMSVINSV